MGIQPSSRSPIFVPSVSMHVTELPESARHAPATSPTYPVPTTQIRTRSSSGLGQVSLERRRAMRGGVLAEHPRPRQDAHLTPLLVRHLAHEAQRLLGRARDEDL